MDIQVLTEAFGAHEMIFICRKRIPRNSLLLNINIQFINVTVY
jgi:hypothetical protein